MWVWLPVFFNHIVYCRFTLLLRCWYATVFVLFFMFLLYLVLFFSNLLFIFSFFFFSVISAFMCVFFPSSLHHPPFLLLFHPLLIILFSVSLFCFISVFFLLFPLLHQHPPLLHPLPGPFTHLFVNTYSYNSRIFLPKLNTAIGSDCRIQNYSLLALGHWVSLLWYSVFITYGEFK